MTPDGMYTAQLQAGMGLVGETTALLDLWSPGMSALSLQETALRSGHFPTMTARRLRNIVKECFAPRYLVRGGAPARHLKTLMPSVGKVDLAQLLLLFTCRANPILGDFIRQIYWPRYAASYASIANSEAQSFVSSAIQEGKTGKPWSATVIRSIAGRLTGCCADYGMLERGIRKERRILPFRISPVTATYLAYDLHFDGVGDGALPAHTDWQLFGLAREDVIDELKRLSLRGLFIIQAAGEVVRISWKQPNMEAVCDVIA